MKKIVSHNKYSRYLSSLDNVSNVEVFESGDVKCELLVKGEVFSILLMSLNDYKMPIVYLCKPKESEARKPHQLYLRKYGLIHLCLSVREDISVKNPGYKKILDYTLMRVIRLLSLSESEEQREFRKEFLYFWNEASRNKRKAKLFVESSTSLKKLTFFVKKNTLIAIEPETQLNKYFLKECSLDVSEGLHIPLINSKGVLPPFKEQPWTIDSLKYIINQCISESNVELLEEVLFSSNIVFLAFEMKLSETIPITFLLKLEFRNKKKGNIFERLQDIISIEHWSSQRCDSGYLYKRIGVNTNNTDKKVLVIGAGSLGSYILSELPKMGIGNITVFDNDDLSDENIMRHRLGSLYTNTNKAFAMKFELESSFPQLLVDYKNEKFKEDKIISYNLEQYDMIIVTTGGTDFMLNLNRTFKEHAINIPVIFSWIEANGIGVHSLLVDYNKKGCFQCLYTDAVKNKAHYGNNQSNISFVGTGCGSVFNSYGNLTLLKGSTMILEIIQMQLGGLLENEKNPLYSIRTRNPAVSKDFVISKRDFETAKDFYISERCEVCGA